MTLEEFNNEFDVIYNSISSNAAPGLDVYEKSVLLTQAQEQLVKNYYNPKGNKYGEGFEMTEKRRRDLNFLVDTGISNNPLNNINAASSVLYQNLDKYRSFFFTVNNNLMFIINEFARASSTKQCFNNKIVDIRPTLHNELSYTLNNPFKKPQGIFAIRLDITKINNNAVVELLCDKDVQLTEYRYRYLRYPKPIILENLPQGLSINNISTATNCELPEHMHREIVARAVELALESTGNPRLQTKAQINQRIE